MSYDPAELPPDPDLDHAGEELRLLAGLDNGRVTVLCEDGASNDTLALVPALFRRARELGEGDR